MSHIPRSPASLSKAEPHAGFHGAQRLGQSVRRFPFARVPPSRPTRAPCAVRREAPSGLPEPVEHPGLQQRAHPEGLGPDSAGSALFASAIRPRAARERNRSMARVRAMVRSHASTVPRDGVYSRARFQTSMNVSWRTSSASPRSLRTRSATPIARGPWRRGTAPPRPRRLPRPARPRSSDSRLRRGGRKRHGAEGGRAPDTGGYTATKQRCS